MWKETTYVVRVAVGVTGRSWARLFKALFHRETIVLLVVADRAGGLHVYLHQLAGTGY
jgi:hypothetical protein